MCGYKTCNLSTWEMWKQEDCSELKASLGYRVRRLCLKQKRDIEKDQESPPISPSKLAELDPRTLSFLTYYLLKSNSRPTIKACTGLTMFPQFWSSWPDRTMEWPFEDTITAPVRRQQPGGWGRVLQRAVHTLNQHPV